MPIAVTKTTTEVIATPCDIYFDGQTLGHTQGGLSINVSRNSFDVNVNDFGPNVSVSKVSLGTGATIEIPLAQYSVSVLEKCIPEALVVSGTSLYVGDTTGTNFLTLAKELKVVPRDGSPQWTFPAAAVTEELTVPFALDEQTIINATFTAFPDPNAPTASGSVFRIEPNGFF